MLLIFLLIAVVIFSVLGIQIGNTIKKRMRAGERMTGKLEKVCKWFYNYNNFFSCIKAASTITLAIILFWSSMTYILYIDMGAKRDAIQETINVFRGDSKIHVAERAAAIQSVVKFNKKLGAVKYWNNNIWVSIAIPNRIANLEYIK